MNKKIKVKSAAFVSVLALMAAGLTSAVASCVAQAYVLSILWGWFIVSWCDAPPLGITQALGLTLVLNLATCHKKGAMPFQERFLSAFLALGLGWVIHLFL